MSSKLFSIGKSSAVKAFAMFVLSTVISVVGDAIIQAVNNGAYSFDAIHWKEIIAAVMVAVVTYLKKEFLTNSDGEFLKKDNYSERVD